MSAVSDTGSERAVRAAGTREAVLDIRDLSIAYRSGGGDVRAVRHVDLTLHRGEVVGLAGESGCGKSTLAYGALRLLRPPAVITGGSVTYHGRRVDPAGVDVLAAGVAQLRELRWREIAIVFQSAMNSLNPVLRVRDHMLDALGAHLSLSNEQRHDRIVELIEMVGIPRARLRSYPHELSGGMRQRVMIAMALAAEPEVVIMDEPTTALDVVVQREILAEIFALKERLGFSVLFITHDLSLLLEIADRVVIMYAGRFVESGTREQIHTRSAHPYTRGLLTSFPRLRGPRRKLSGIPGSPPDLRGALIGCPFIPRCRFGVGLGSSNTGELEPFGEVVDPRERARLLDEGLAGLAEFWAGRFEPVPVQQPRIPVWVAGRWPKRRPLTRALQWDGFFPIELPGPEALMELAGEIADKRSAGGGAFDLVVEIEPGEDAGPWAQAGATWVLTDFGRQPTVAGVRRAIDAGPR